MNLAGRDPCVGAKTAAEFGIFNPCTFQVFQAVFLRQVPDQLVFDTPILNLDLPRFAPRTILASDDNHYAILWVQLV